MPKLIHKLREQKPTLVVSLVQNSLEMAKAAEDSGADGLKVHVNFFHPPTGICIPEYEQEAEKIHQILENISIPVGIVPRGWPGTPRSEVEKYRDLGFDYVDFYGKNISADAMSVPDVTKWIAVDAQYNTERLQALAELPFVDAIEAAFLPPSIYAAPLNIDDLAILRAAVIALDGSDKPLILPTDRGLTVEDMPIVLDIGIRNIMIGVAVTGVEARKIAEATRAFRKVLV